MRCITRCIAICGLSAFLLACGGGGNSSATNPSPVTQPNTPPSTFTLSPSSLSGTKDVDLDSDFVVNDLNPVLPYSWTVTGLPDGLAFSISANTSHMRIFGRPKVAGIFQTHVVVRDSSAGQPVRVDTIVTINLDTAFKFSNTFVPTGVQGLPYSYQIPVANGVVPLTYQITSGTIPTGLSLDTTTGLLAGVPNVLNPYSNVGVRVTDSSNPPRSVQAIFTGLEIVRLLTFTNQTTAAFKGTSVFIPVSFMGGVSPVSVKLIGGSLPPGISIDANSPTLVGAPTQVGTFTANIEIKDSYSPPEVVTGTITFFVNNSPPQIKADFPHGIVGVPYAYSLSAVGGTRPFQWKVTGLPPGLAADGNGNITGTPTTSGIYQSIAIQLTDSSQPSPVFAGTSGIIRVKPFTGRNDSTANATAATNGIYNASLSPYADAAGVAQPDHDYYQATVGPGATLQVTVEPLQPNTIDPVSELLDASGTRMSACKLPGGTAFTSPCLNDDIDPGINHTSNLQWQNSSASDQVVYIHVLDWSGNARPDFKYRMTITGAK